jgi:hypothetical protein
MQRRFSSCSWCFPLPAPAEEAEETAWPARVQEVQHSARYLPPLLLIAHFCVQLLMQLLTVPIPCVLHGPVLQNSSHVFFCANAGNELRARLIAAINIIGLSMFHPPS